MNKKIKSYTHEELFKEFTKREYSDYYDYLMSFRNDIHELFNKAKSIPIGWPLIDEDSGEILSTINLPLDNLGSALEGPTIDAIKRVINTIDNDTYHAEILQYPNGKMNAPDLKLKINNKKTNTSDIITISIDIKSVKCKRAKTNNELSISFNNAAYSQYNLKRDIDKYQKTGKKCNTLKSYILYVFYEITDNNDIKVHGFLFTPFVRAIKYSKDFVIGVKSGGDGEKIKNSNVNIGLKQKDNRTYDEILEILTKLKTYGKNGTSD